MKREEALEYMNRYLDHDLNEEETETLFRHLGESPDAQADFDFLQSLSDKLESLPDVQPPISLVDSILPRLEEIDRAAPLKYEEQPGQPTVMLPAKQTPPRRKAAAFWRSTLGRAVGGTAVAAAVLGIFVATYKPQEMPNAEVTSTAAVSNATDDTLVSDGAADKKAAPDLTDPSTEVQEMQPEAQKLPEDGVTENKADSPDQESRPAETGDQQKESQAVTPDSSSPAVPEPNTGGSSDSKKENGAEQGESESKKAAPDDSDKTPSPPKDTPAKNPPSGDAKKNTVPSAPNSNANANTNSDKDTAPKLQSPTPPASDEPASTEKVRPEEGMRSSNADEEKEAGDVNPKLQDSSSPESNSLNESEADSRAYSLMAAPTEWTSPDGTYLIRYAEGTLTLQKGDRSEELGTLKVDGEATNGVWSADGKTFTYDLVKPDGTAEPQTWKVEETALKQGK